MNRQEGEWLSPMKTIRWLQVEADTRVGASSSSLTGGKAVAER